MDFLRFLSFACRERDGDADLGTLLRSEAVRLALRLAPGLRVGDAECPGDIGGTKCRPTPSVSTRVSCHVPTSVVMPNVSAEKSKKK